MAKRKTGKSPSFRWTQCKLNHRRAAVVICPSLVLSSTFSFLWPTKSSACSVLVLNKGYGWVREGVIVSWGNMSVDSVRGICRRQWIWRRSDLCVHGPHDVTHTIGLTVLTWPVNTHVCAAWCGRQSHLVFNGLYPDCVLEYLYRIPLPPVCPSPLRFQVSFSLLFYFSFFLTLSCFGLLRLSSDSFPSTEIMR